MGIVHPFAGNQPPFGRAVVGAELVASPPNPCGAPVLLDPAFGDAPGWGCSGLQREEQLVVTRSDWRHWGWDWLIL